MTDNDRTLARALRRVFTEGAYSRAEWAEILEVSTAALSQWTSARQIPTPRSLAWIRETVRETDGMSDGLRALIDDVFSRPLRQVVRSPKPNMGRTLDEYVQRVATEEAMKNVMSLPADDQRRIVEAVSLRVRDALRPTARAGLGSQLKFAAEVLGDSTDQDFAPWAFEKEEAS